MAKKEEARAVLNKILSSKKDKYDFRFAVTGDGGGAAASNLYVSQDKRYMWVRDINNLDRPYTVLHRGRVSPKVNLPVIIGRDDIEPQFEKILGLNYDGLPGNIATSATLEVGQHHTQHEWDGGDEVFIDSRQLLPGLVLPTNPESMKVRIKPFTFFHGEWKRFGGSITVDFSASAPSGNRFNYILVSLDPSGGSSGSPLYEGGNSSSIAIGDPVDIQNRNTLGIIPAPKHDYIPLGAIYLTASTTSIGWGDVDNLLDTRQLLDKAENPSYKGDMRFSPDGESWQRGVPVTEKAIGQQLMDEDTGYLLFS